MKTGLGGNSRLLERPLTGAHALPAHPPEPRTQYFLAVISTQFYCIPKLKNKKFF